MFKKLSETCALVGLLSFFASLTICIIEDLLDEYLHMGAASLYKYLMIMASVTILIFVVSSIILWLFQWIQKRPTG